VIVNASRHDDVRAVVSLSSFAHPNEVMGRLLSDLHLPYPLFGWYVLRHVQRVIGARFDDIAPLHTVTRACCPVLLVHGRDDTTVPFGDARRIAAARHDVCLLPVDGGHDLREALPPHAGRLIEFLTGAFADAAPAQSGERPSLR
jgi:fermentation-respiration switch protein FrsA (DUF1100 family)